MPIARTAVLAWLGSWAVLTASLGAEKIPRSEHPRPDFQRDAWITLNGPWQFRFDPEDRGLREKWWAAETAGWDRRIVVPFCWESRASGIADRSGQTLGWYRRRVVVPQAWRGRQVWLRFEAVDHEATVWVNGVEVGRHEGGYSPFQFDVTKLAEPGREATVVVRARDATDPETSLGLQSPHGYTPTSGIWQTVWLESRPARHVRGLRMIPRFTGSEWSLDVEVNVAGPDGPAWIELVSPDEAFSPQRAALTIRDGRARHWTAINVTSPQVWSPEQPHLYDLDVRIQPSQDDKVNVDLVHTYFGLRTIARGGLDGGGRPAILLNGKPVFLRGALDASFNPEGIGTAPSDAFLRRDVELARRLGMNFLRIHVKAEEPRRLYWADRLGILLMADMPCTWLASPRARENWQRTMEATLQRDGNHPSIIAWCLFNESWGLGGRDYRADRAAQEWVEQMWTRIKEKLDPARLVEDNSTSLLDHVKTDLNTWHFRGDDYIEARQNIERMVRGTQPGSTMNFVPGRTQGNEPLVVSEYSGVPPHGGDRDVAWSFRYLTTLLRQYDLIQGCVYAGLSDVEWTHNGLVNYDRTRKEFGYDAFVSGMTVADLEGADFVGCDAPPILMMAPEETFTLPVFVSHYSSRREAPTLQWQIVGTDDLGQDVSSEAQQVQAVWRPYQVTFQKLTSITIPTSRSMVGALTLELIDNGGDRIAANYVNLIVRPAASAPTKSDEPTAPLSHWSPRIEILGRRLVALRFSPDDFKAFRSDEPMTHWLTPRSRFHSSGRCEVEYEIALPKFVRNAVPTQIALMAELATKAGPERLDWPEVRRELDCPQTEHRQYPGKVAVLLENKLRWQFDLPDDPADASGVLSHEQGWQQGSYGYLVRQRADLSREMAFREVIQSAKTVSLIFRAVEETIDGKPRARGLSLFGEQLGRYPVDPTLIIETARDLDAPIGSASSKPIVVNRLLDRVRRQTGLPTAAQGGHAWRWTTTAPAADWLSPEASDAGWATGPSGFGPPGLAGFHVGTEWTGPEIWLRAEVQIDAMPREILLNVYHAEPVEIYVNGKPLLTRSAGTPEYQSILLSKTQRKLFRPGRNTVAVHGRQRDGRQGLDVGLEWVRITKGTKDGKQGTGGKKPGAEERRSTP